MSPIYVIAYPSLVATRVGTLGSSYFITDVATSDGTLWAVGYEIIAGLKMMRTLQWNGTDWINVGGLGSTQGILYSIVDDATLGLWIVGTTIVSEGVTETQVAYKWNGTDTWVAETTGLAGGNGHLHVTLVFDDELWALGHTGIAGEKLNSAAAYKWNGTDTWAATEFDTAPADIRAATVVGSELWASGFDGAVRWNGTDEWNVESSGLSGNTYDTIIDSAGDPALTSAIASRTYYWNQPNGPWSGTENDPADGLIGSRIYRTNALFGEIFYSGTISGVGRVFNLFNAEMIEVTGLPSGAGVFTAWNVKNIGSAIYVMGGGAVNLP